MPVRLLFGTSARLLLICAAFLLAARATEGTARCRTVPQVPVSYPNWVPIELTFTLPLSGGPVLETDPLFNPWLDVRLDAKFRKSPEVPDWRVVPGFFAGDGTSGTVTGNKWKVRFTPFGTPGAWEFRVTAWEGAGVNLLPAGTTPPVPAQQIFYSEGALPTVSAPMSAPGFHRKGILRHVGDYYFRFDNGEYFLKTGSGGPENFLAYREFTGWAAHDQWQQSNPAGGPDHLVTCHITNPGYPVPCSNPTWTASGVRVVDGVPGGTNTTYTHSSTGRSARIPPGGRRECRSARVSSAH